MVEVVPFVPFPVYKSCDLALLELVEVLLNAANFVRIFKTKGMVRLPRRCLFHVHLIDCLDVGYDGHHDPESVVCAQFGQNLFHSLVVSGRLYLYGRERSRGVYAVDVKVSDFYLVAFLLSVFLVREDGSSSSGL